MGSYHIEYITGQDWYSATNIEADDHTWEDDRLTLFIDGQEVAVFQTVSSWHFTDNPEQTDVS